MPEIRSEISTSLGDFQVVFYDIKYKCKNLTFEMKEGLCASKRLNKTTEVGH